MFPINPQSVPIKSKTVPINQEISELSGDLYVISYNKDRGGERDDTINKEDVAQTAIIRGSDAQIAKF